jgi:hypothetical protein
MDKIERHPIISFAGNAGGLYASGKDVLLDYNAPFDRDTDEWDSAYGTFTLENYLSGIKELRASSRCTIKGEDCLMEFKKLPDGKVDLYFNGSGYGNNITLLGINLDLEKRIG